MKEGDIIASTVQFFVDGVRIRFVVLHNLPEVHGLSLNDAVINWANRTDKHTAESLCKYINSKGTDHVCILPTKKNIAKYLGKGVKIIPAEIN